MPNIHSTIYQHDIEWSLEDESVKELDDSDIEHIAYMISEGYSEGELNHGEQEVRGWWKIKRN